MLTGRIINIQKYSIHDGPGIRTTVFFKGCPLKCWWCHNPESQEMKPNILVINDKCIGCHSCVSVCTASAITAENNRFCFEREKCIGCGNCAQSCPTEARTLAGKESTVAEIMQEITKDTLFYEQSKGGVTFSGGEPFAQPEFLLALARECKKNGLHVALDTCGFVSTTILERIQEFVDLWLYDLKIIDSEKHQKYTGVPSKPILENLLRLSQSFAQIRIRIPLIPGINDDDENITSTARFLSTLKKVEAVHLLPYHHISQDKYNRLGWRYPLPETPEPTQNKIISIKQSFEAHGITTIVGG